MRPNRLLLASTLAAFALLAGCAGPSASVGGAQPLLAEDGSVLDVSGLHLVGNGLGAPLDHTVWANGTITTQDTCDAGACIMDTSRAAHPIDLAAHMPPGVPVRVVVEARYEPNPVRADNNDLWLDVPDGTYYAYEQESPEPGVLRVTAIVRSAGQATAVFFTQSQGADPAATPYALFARVQAEPSLVPGGVPVALQMAAGDTLRLGSGGAFRLFGPDDQPVGAFAGNVTLPASARTGDYAVLLPPDAPASNLSVSGAAKSWQALGIRLVAGEPIHTPPAGVIDVPWTATGVPLGVGFMASPTPAPAGITMLVSTGFLIQLRQDGEALLDSGWLCGLCITGGYGLSMSTPIGDERAVAGEYVVHADTQGTQEMEVVPFTLELERAG